MTSAEQIPQAREREPVTPVRTAAIVVYATFSLLVLTIPQSLVNWLHDMEENPVQQVLLRAASGVQAASRAAGLDIPYRRARAAFHEWTGKEDD
jgi:hypothetical protein